MMDNKRCQHTSSCKPKTCCRHTVLRTGSIIVAMLYIAGNIAATLGFVLFIIYAAIVLPSDEKDKVYVFCYILIGVVLISGVNIALNSLLVRGVRGAKRRLVLFWVIWYGIFTALTILGWLGSFIMWMYMASTLGPPSTGLGIFFTFVHFFLGLFILPVMWLCHSCVVSYLGTMAPGNDNALVAKLLRQNTRYGMVTIPSRDAHAVEAMCDENATEVTWIN